MFKKLAAATALIIASSAAFAAQPSTFYAGADIGRTKIDDFSNRDTSVGAFVGYNINQNLAVEGSFRRLADFDVRLAGTNVNVRGDQLAASVIGSLPVGESFSVYGRLGLNRIEVKAKALGSSADDAETKALFGLGVSYAFTPAISARVEVQKPASDVTNVSAGVAFQF
eukprot:TRINITY_DN13848_c0_g1_i1.p1 TRINITY_DN13848_c0_g1~~TRINITY_DN13848_c0_g1_i1.p1  ORF type:complete len:169 (-),score=61.43 TRINITY_DN13848_c0_g1_i1:122-628(-)